MRQFNAIVIGLGLIGMKYGFDPKRTQPASHIAAIAENNDLQLVGVCDTNKDSINVVLEKHGKVSVFENYIELVSKINQKEIACDIIVIATPDSTHGEILEFLIQNLNSQKVIIIFCEKPLTLNLSSATKIKSLLKNSNLKIVVNHSRRWSKIWKEAYNLTKDIGEIKKASFYFSTSPENKKIEQIRDGIHIADLIKWFGIIGKTAINRLDVSYFIYDFYLWGSEGKIEILSNGEVLNFFKSDKSSRYEGFQELKLIKTIKNKEAVLSNTYKEFVEYLNGNTSSLSVDIDDAVSALDIFEKYIFDPRISKN